MATRTTTARPLTDERSKIAADFGYKTRIVRSVAVTDLVPAVQTRVQGKFPEDVLQQYMESMRGGAEFPYPLITEDKGVVLGKTTVEAYRRLGTATVDCLVLDGVYFTNAKQSLLDDLILMDAYSNQTNGVRLTDEDLKAIIAVGFANNVTAQQLARRTGVHVRNVNAEFNLIKAKDRLEALKISETGLQSPQLKVLGKVAHRLNDAPFKALAELTKDAGLRTHEIDSYAHQALEARSDTTAVKKINDARTGVLTSRIRQNRITGSHGPRTRTPLEIMNLHLAGILAFSGREEEVLHREPVSDQSFAEPVRIKLDMAINILSKIRADL